jgi:hypothetical protein
MAASNFAFPMIAASLVVTLTAGHAAPSSRVIETARDLRKACAFPRESAEERDCLAYIEGVAR